MSGGDERSALRVLSRAARAWADREGAGASGAAAERKAAEGWLALEQARGRSGRPVSATSGAAPRWGLALGMVGFALALGAVVAFVTTAGEAPLDFAVRGAPAPGDGRPVRAGDGPARLSFSDGTEVVLERGAEGMVVGTSGRGARIRLGEGRARFKVAHRPRADWAVEAGPFRIVVHGTEFDVDWSQERSALRVDLNAGKVTIEGPMPGGTVALRPGERFSAHGSTDIRIERVGEADARTAAGQPARAVARPVEPVGQTVGEDRDPGERSGAEVAVAPAANPEEGAAKRGRARPRKLALAEDRLDGAGWPERVASGAFASVVAEAEALGIGRCLSELGPEPLSALADAARYLQRPALARRALLAERERFPHTVAARDAAFLLGRLADDVARDRREALAWYDRYLSESGDRGTYASEALGRRMLALAGTSSSDAAAAAAAAAARYLAAFPDGPYAARARRLAGQ
jgi:ferric-dicitrate binding protein FerR (iron transport regulator)